jgi:hypothetical protein
MTTDSCIEFYARISALRNETFQLVSELDGPPADATSFGRRYVTVALQDVANRLGDVESMLRDLARAS